ncbi:MAG: hypothetical protein QNJ08_14310 [Crocosphaera sp.]|nr:hypothetical protein [Crocosphaera sp.]
MLLFSGSHSFPFILATCQPWQPGVMEKHGLEHRSNFPTKPTTVFNLPLGSPSHGDYPLSGDNQPQEIRISLTLKSGWRRRIFPIPR